MTTSTTEVEPVEPGGSMPSSHVEVHGHQHPSDKKYIVIAVILGVITAAEVGTYFVEDPSTTFLVASLIPMMIAKFAIVCGYFMHLKFDNPIFRRVFVFGLVLAAIVYAAVMLTAMEFWSPEYGG